MARRGRASRVRQGVMAVLVALGLGAAAAAVLPTAEAAGSLPQCSTADLSAQLKAGSPGAGQRYATVVLTDISAHSCTLGGYGGLALLGAPRQGVPIDVRRMSSPAPTTVTLSPGASARSLLHWTVVPASDEPATCEPTAGTVVVTPPNQTTAFLRSWPFGPVCQHGLIWQNAYASGSAAY
jgi:uncharacterized protein DUF4232